MKIIKRNGSEATFDLVKIIAAVTKANNVVAEDARMTPMQIRRIAESVENSCLSMNRALSVEEIQDLVEVSPVDAPPGKPCAPEQTRKGRTTT